MKNIEDLTFKNLYDPDYVYLTQSLIRAVIIRHFSYLDFNDREEASAIALAKVSDLLKKDDFDRSRGSLKNYLYTGIRNSIGNHFSKYNREIPVEDDIMEFHNPSYDGDPEVYLKDHQINHIFNLFRGRLDHLRNQTLTQLESMGFSCPYHINETPSKKAIKMAIFIIWRYKETS